MRNFAGNSEIIAEPSAPAIGQPFNDSLYITVTGSGRKRILIALSLEAFEPSEDDIFAYWAYYDNQFPRNVVDHSSWSMLEAIGLTKLLSDPTTNSWLENCCLRTITALKKSIGQA